MSPLLANLHLHWFDRAFSFRYDRDLLGRSWRYLNVQPSPEAVQRERTKLTELSDHRQCVLPVEAVVDRLNRHLSGWGNYFNYGYARDAFRQINYHVLGRMARHLRRRSQRGWSKAPDVSVYAHLQKLGLKAL